MFRRFAVIQGGAWRLPSLRSALGYEVAAPFGATSPYLRTSLALSRVGLIKSHLWKCQNGRWRVAHIDGDVRLVDGHEPPSYISTECSVDLRTDNPNGRKASGGNAFTGSEAPAEPKPSSAGASLSHTKQVTKLYFGGLLISPKAEHAR